MRIGSEKRTVLYGLNCSYANEMYYYGSPGGGGGGGARARIIE